MPRLTALLAAFALLTFAPPAQADHGHNCVWLSGGWVGQGLCPGMPGYVPHTDPPTPEPTPEPTTSPDATSPAPGPVATTPAPAPSSTPTPTRTAPAVTPAPTTTRTPGCLRSYGNTWCTGGATPAPVVAAAVAVAPVAAPSPAVTLAFPGQVARGTLLPT